MPATMISAATNPGGDLVLPVPFAELIDDAAKWQELRNFRDQPELQFFFIDLNRRSDVRSAELAAAWVLSAHRYISQHFGPMYPRIVVLVDEQLHPRQSRLLGDAGAIVCRMTVDAFVQDVSNRKERLDLLAQLRGRQPSSPMSSSPPTDEELKRYQRQGRGQSFAKLNRELPSLQPGDAPHATE